MEPSRAQNGCRHVTAQHLPARCGRQEFLFSVIDPHLSNPYTVQSLISFEARHRVHVDGRSRLRFEPTAGTSRSSPIRERVRQAGGSAAESIARTISGITVSSEQTMVYNALQTSLRRRFTKRFSVSTFTTRCVRDGRNKAAGSARTS